jgi:hypothetical protein
VPLPRSPVCCVCYASADAVVATRSQMQLCTLISDSTSLSRTHGQCGLTACLLVPALLLRQE